MKSLILLTVVSAGTDAVNPVNVWTDKNMALDHFDDKFSQLIFQKIYLRSYLQKNLKSMMMRLLPSEF